jgi:Rho GTPase-activating protein 1
MKHEREIRLPMPVKQDIFGVPLEELMGWDAEKGGVPRVVKDAVQYLRETGEPPGVYGRARAHLITLSTTGLEEEGLFRRSPNSALLRHVQEAYDRGVFSATHVHFWICSWAT